MKVLTGYVCKAAVLLLAAQFGSLFADNILELRRLEALHRRAESEVERLRLHNRALVHEAHALRHDPFYVELTMRRKLRWIGPREQRFRPASGGLLYPSMPAHIQCQRTMEKTSAHSLLAQAQRSTGGY
ncbi:MAG: hypothetical protein HQ592_11535 [Planctomycetes bacterium]|nr:hypothetical protein [Planctomycetota bacterium]